MSSSSANRPRLPYATGSAGLAITVRGSSRRIMIMRFRPANIRLINRRSNLARLLRALSSGKENANHQNPTDFAQLTRSLHIRAMHVSRMISVETRIGAISHQLRSRLRSSLSGWEADLEWEPPTPALRNAASKAYSFACYGFGMRSVHEKP